MADMVIFATIYIRRIPLFVGKRNKKFPFENEESNYLFCDFDWRYFIGFLSTNRNRVNITEG
ncbi:hypothetical protein CHL76_02440 [Marinococcus halophilus]|nr:hypothetical protein CHL76_02440 [Marinococcus halophilus]